MISYQDIKCSLKQRLMKILTHQKLSETISNRHLTNILLESLLQENAAHWRFLSNFSISSLARSLSCSKSFNLLSNALRAPSTTSLLLSGRDILDTVDRGESTSHDWTVGRSVSLLNGGTVAVVTFIGWNEAYGLEGLVPDFHFTKKKLEKDQDFNEKHAV